MARYRTTPLDSYGDIDAGEDPIEFDSLGIAIAECFSDPDGNDADDVDAIRALKPAETYIVGGGAAAAWLWERLPDEA